MKNIYKLIIGLVLVVLIVVGVIAIDNLNKKEAEKDTNKHVITATFYPQYIALMNIMAGAQNVKYDILNSKNVGCLHHYSITTADMKKFEDSDIIILNGAGMEEKMIDYIDNLNKNTIDSSAGIDTIEGEDETNAHTFLSIKSYIKQVENIRDELVNLDSDNADIYTNNSFEYIQKLNELDVYAQGKFANINSNKIVTGHSTFDYFARDYSLEVVATLQGDEEEQPSAKELQEIIEKIKSEKVKVIFSETSGDSELANTVAKDSGATVYTLNDITGGELNKDAYIDLMKSNINTISEALSER